MEGEEENSAAAALQIYLDEWIIGDNHYNGIFSISRYINNDIGADDWTYEYRDFY